MARIRVDDGETYRLIDGQDFEQLAEDLLTVLRSGVAARAVPVELPEKSAKTGLLLVGRSASTVLLTPED